MIEADETSVHGVEESLTEVTAALCAAIDSEGLGAPIQERLHLRKLPEASWASASQQTKHPRLIAEDVS
jgi:hypothetical protein